MNKPELRFRAHSELDHIGQHFQGSTFYRIQTVVASLTTLVA